MPQTDLEQLVFQMDANISKLNKSVDQAITKVDGGAAKMQKRADELSTGMFAKFTGAPEFTKSLDKIFDSSRLAVIEEGSAKLRIFGSAIEPLGGIGIAAAAGIALLGVAFESVSKAAENINSLGIRAEKLGLGTTALQEFDAQAHVVDVTSQELDKGLGGLAETMGRLEAGVRLKRIQPFLDQLGISPADVQKANGDVGKFFDLIADRLEGYSAQEKRAIAEGLGIGSELLPLLDMEKSKRDQINAALKQYIIPPEVVQKTKEQTEELNKQHEILDAQLRKDWSDLIPIVNGLKSAWMGVEGAIANAAVATLKLPGQFEHALPGALGAIGNLVGGPLGGAIGGSLDTVLNQKPGDAGAPASEQTKAREASVARTNAENTLTSALKSEVNSLVDHHQHLEEINTKIAGYIQKLNATGSAIPQLPSGGFDESRLSAGQRDSIAALRANANKEDAQGISKKAAGIDKEDVEAIHQATIKYLEAQIKYTGDLDKLHQLNVLKINQDADSTRRELGDRLKSGSITRGAYDTAAAANEGTRQQQITNAGTEDQISKLSRSAELVTQQSQMDAAALTAKAALAKTAQERAALEIRSFQIEQAGQLASSRAEDQAKVLSGKISQAMAKQLDAVRVETQADQLLARQKQARLEEEQRLDEIAKSSAAIAERISNAQAQLAATQAARVALEREALERRQAQERSDLQKNVDAGNASPSDIPALASAQSSETKDFDQKNQGPLGQWVTETNKAANDVGNALQTEAVKGINDFNQALANSIVNSKNFGDAFRSIIKQIESDLIELLLKQSEVGLFSAAGVGGGSSGGGIFGAIGSFFGGAHADGGILEGPGGPRDDNIIIRASPGEFVVNAQSTSKNLSLLHAINRGKIGKFADGGLVGSGLLAGIGGRESQAAGGSVVHQHFSLDARGALMFEDFQMQLNAKIKQTGATAAIAGAQGGHALTMSTLQKQSRNRLR